ncbi:MAG: MarR family winged helix-turn-helix transcriptional regulator [Bryobacteraceae bacterium]|nr:MarR family winged helix-turn-helix transcriptional regulator [Bryobacteraceae bacterium]
MDHGKFSSVSLPDRVLAGFSRIAQVLRTNAWREASPRGLTATQGAILTILRREGGCRLAELASGLGVSMATASDAVASLVEKGLVKKERQAGDGRALKLTLTRQGRKDAGGLTEWPESLAAAVEGLNGAEQRTLLAALMRMVRALQEGGEIPVARMCTACCHFRPNVHKDRQQPHHCSYVDAAFGAADLRLECGDFQAAPAEQAESAWKSVFPII